jgi:hypothetical protein
MHEGSRRFRVGSPGTPETSLDDYCTITTPVIVEWIEQWY